MKRLLADRPWILVVAAILFFLGLSAVFYAIAILNPPAVMD